MAADLKGPLTVFAAASLTEAFTDEEDVLKTDAPNLAISYDFAGSQSLVQQIQQGAPADVFASADTKSRPAIAFALQISEVASVCDLLAEMARVHSPDAESKSSKSPHPRASDSIGVCQKSLPPSAVSSAKAITPP